MNDSYKNIIFAEERRQQILNILHKNKKIVVPELCALFEVSPSTIRNDLRELEENKLITRTHGGAISNSKVSLEPLPSEKKEQKTQQKLAIGKLASTLVDDGDIIAICTGTTTLEFAKQLLHKKNLTIILNDIHLAYFLEQNSDFKIFMLGGFIRKSFHHTITSGAPLPKIQMDKIFFGANGLSFDSGITIPDLHLANNIASLLTMASEKIVLCDSSKFGHVAFAQIASISEVNTIVTDSDISPSELQAFNQVEHCTMLIAQL